jgi:hypothetical protein
VTPDTEQCAAAPVTHCERLRVHVEQRLELCGLCRRVLALQYHWHADRLPTWSRDRVLGRRLRCPACGYTNFFLTLMYGDAFELKLVPGPEPGVPFPAFPATKAVRVAEAPKAAEPPSSTMLIAPVLRAFVAYLRFEMLIAWWVSRVM